MKKSIILFVGAFLCSMLNAAEPVSIKDGIISLDCTGQSWGKPARIQSVQNPEKTPDGENTVGFEVKAGPTVYMYTNAERMKPLWEKLKFEWVEFSCWIWSDGSETPVTLIFYAKDKNGKPGVMYCANFKLIHKGWKLHTVKGLWCNRNQEGRLRFDRLQNFSFYASPKKDCKFLLGPLRFKIKDHVPAVGLPVTEALPVSSPPAIDGNDNDPCWRNLSSVKLIPQNRTGTPVPEVKIGYDRKNVYVLFSQQGDTSGLIKNQTRHEGGVVWKDDSFQIFFSPRNDNRSYHQFVINSLNTRESYHSYFDVVAEAFVFRRNLQREKWQSAARIFPDRWIVECQIDRKYLGIENGELHGLQIYVNNPSNKTGFWFSPASSAINPQLYGVIRFSDRAGQIERMNPPVISLNVKELVIHAGEKFRWQMATPGGRVYVPAEEADSSVRDTDFFRESGCQRFVLFNEKSVFAGETAAFTFASKTPYGTTTLAPKPKKFTLGKGTFIPAGEMKIRHSPKNRETALEIQKDFAGLMGFQLELSADGTLLGNKIVIGKEHPIQSPEKESGYAVKILPDGIILQGHDSAGLHYAGISLGQLERYAFLRNENSLPVCEISDWPDLPYRIFHLWSDACYNQYDTYKNGLYSKAADTGEEKIDALRDYSRRFVFGCKMNFYRFQAPDIIRYERPENQRFNHQYNWMSIAQLKDFARFTEKNHCEFVPQVAGSSHADYMLTRVDKSMVLKGYCDWNADPTHPNFFRYLFGVYDELNAAVKPRFFCTAEDEWLHMPTGPVSTMKQGKLWRDIFYETIVREHDKLKESGIRQVIESDMLQRYHNGGKPFDNYLNLDRLPKDIILSSWYGGEDALAELAGKGFWTMAVYPAAMGHFNTARLKPLKNFKGSGTILSGGWGGTYSGGLPRVVGAAEYAWNFFTMKPLSLNDYIYADGGNIMAMLSVKGNPAASRRFVPVDLSGYCNAVLPSQSIPGGKVKMGFIPMMIPPGRMIQGGAEPVQIPIRRKAASLIFLHTQLLEKNASIYKMSCRINGWTGGNKTGEYRIRFRNGKEIPIYMRDTMNSGYFRSYAGTREYLKYGPDIRYVWEGGSGKEFLYQYEWPNPWPEQEIESVSFRSMGSLTPGVIPCLAALTLREIR